MPLNRKWVTDAVVPGHWVWLISVSAGKEQSEKLIPWIGFHLVVSILMQCWRAGKKCVRRGKRNDTLVVGYCFQLMATREHRHWCCSVEVHQRLWTLTCSRIRTSLPTATYHISANEYFQSMVMQRVKWPRNVESFCSVTGERLQHHQIIDGSSSELNSLLDIGTCLDRNWTKRNQFREKLHLLPTCGKATTF